MVDGSHGAALLRDKIVLPSSHGPSINVCPKLDQTGGSTNADRGLENPFPIVMTEEIYHGWRKFQRFPKLKNFL